MNRKYLLYAIVPVLALISLGTTVYAFGPQGGTYRTGLVAKIAQKFNLNQADVQAVFDEQKSQMQAQRQTQVQQKFTDSLSQAVANGRLTQTQADLITAKKAESESLKVSLQGKTKDEISAAMKAQSVSLKQWAINNNIPVNYLRLLRLGGEHGGMWFKDLNGDKASQPAS